MPKPSKPVSLLYAALRDLRGGRDAQETLFAIANSLVQASQDAVAQCGAQLSLFPDAHFIGQGKFHIMQERFLQVGAELGLPITVERHPGGTSYYAALEHPRLRITIAKVRRYGLNPPLHPFRLETRLKHFRPGQLPLLPDLHATFGEQLVCVIVFGYARGNRATPAYMEVRFLSEDGKSFSEFALDLLQLRKAAESPSREFVAEERRPAIRKRRARDA